MKKIKILYIVPSLRLCNGVASYAMNYFRNINKEEIKIDFITQIDERNVYYQEIQKNNSRIFHIPGVTMKNFFTSINTIREFYKKNKYDIIHCHTLNMGAFHLYYAKKNGIKVRILHSHATKYSDKVFSKLRNIFFSYFSKRYANEYFACSKLAGDFLFKNKKYTVINNSININKFAYNENIRNKIRNQENININDFVVLNVGRFVPQKNILFLLDVMKEVINKKNNYKLILIGGGPLENKIKEKINKLELNKNVIIKNNIQNVNEYMYASDLFVLPSLFEGLPVVGIEAQCTGLNCLLSDQITEEVKINDNVNFLSINNKKKWIEEILKSNKQYTRNNNIEKFIERKYEIKESAKDLTEIYKRLAEK